ncbi:MAG TPA: TonB family protein [Thermoanaerobaculia bacterium]|jgi:serine/threonine-protein kinase|nr:TonB family protein [Thermoanaerobaculia bacterium]
MTLPFDAIEGKYEILGKLREGGMGAVYKVRHRLLEEIRVIKLIQPHLGVGAEVGDRFLREAKMAIQLRHPNIAQLHDFAVDPDGKAFIVMEYIDGLTLEDVRKASGPPPLGLGLEIAQQTLRAVGYLHKKGFLHRDIAPDNLMLTRGFDDGPLVKLIDLGIARVLAGDQRLTSTGLFLGKPRYASPEQFGGDGTEGSEEIDARSDLYSFGVVLYELLTGVCPIAGKEASSLMAGHLFRPPIDFAASDPQGKIPADLRTILLKTLAKRPEERFATAEELAGRLAAIQARYPIAPGDLAAVLHSSAASAPRVLAPPAAAGTTQGRLDREFGPEPTPAPQARAWTNPGATVVLAAHTAVLPSTAPVPAPLPEVAPAIAPPASPAALAAPAVLEPSVQARPRDGRRRALWLPLAAVLLLLLALGIWQPWRTRVQTVPAAVTADMARRSEPASPPPPPAVTPVPAAVPAVTPVTTGERTEPTSAVATAEPTPVPAPLPAPAVIPAPAPAPAPVRRTAKPTAPPPPAPIRKRAPKQEVLSAAEAFESESPQPLSMSSPVYPEAARGSGAHAAVTVAVLVDTQGGVKEARIKKSAVDGSLPAASFEQAALEAARKWRFEPGQKRGAPVEMWWEMTFDFGKKPQ